MTKLLQDISIGQNIQRLRKARGLTQLDVIAQMGIKGRHLNRSTYVKIESGTRNIKIGDLIALKEIFAVSYDDFFQGLTLATESDD